MCLIKGAFVGEKNFERYQNARYNNKKPALLCALKVRMLVLHVRFHTHIPAELSLTRMRKCMIPRG
jgi:hypothetical protein